MERLLVLILISSFVTLGCQRDKAGGSSTITIQVPRALNTDNKTGGVGAMGALPSDRKVCYGVNVSGPGITVQPANACSPPPSIRAGFVEPGTEVSVSVPKGSGRVVELFAFLGEPGQTAPCPAFSPSLSPTQILRTYKIGTASNIDISAEVTVVEITADFPGLSNNIAQQLSLPASCTAGGGQNNAPGFNTSSGRGIATNGTMKLYGGFGKPSPGRRATNGTMTLSTE